MKLDDLTYKVAMENRRMIYNLVISLAKKGVISYDEAREIESPAEEDLEENETEIKIEKKSEADLIEEIGRLNAEKAVLQTRLDKIEALARSGFEHNLKYRTDNETLFRAQKLSEIFQIFEYDL